MNVDIIGYVSEQVTEYLVESAKKFSLQKEIVAEVFYQVKILVVILSVIMFGAGMFAGFIIGILFVR